MYKTWTTTADSADQLARELEVHLNEYAGDVITVAYAVDGSHYVLVVYRAMEITIEAANDAVAAAESIIDESHA